MYIKNLTPNHVSLFHGGLLIKRGEATTITKADAESREIADAVRRGWLSMSETELPSEPVAEPAITVTDPATINSLSAEQVVEELQPAKKTKAPKSVEPAPATEASAQ